MDGLELISLVHKTRPAITIIADLGRIGDELPHREALWEPTRKKEPFDLQRVLEGVSGSTE
jgi:hypothetical protein